MLKLEPSDRPVASIIILTQNNLALLRDCLGSIANSVDAVRTPYEVLVLFNGTPADAAKTFMKNVTGTRSRHVALNLGFGGGNNFAAKEAKGRFLVFLNDDTITEPGWLEALVAAAERDASIGIVGSRIVFPDGSLQEAGGIIWSDGSTRPLGRGEPPQSLAYSYVRQVDYTSANGMLIRRVDFEALGGFDSRFFPAYYEDTDLCLGVRHTLGKAIVYEPRSVIRHIEAASSPNADFRSFLFRRNQALLVDKWAEELATYAAPEPESPMAVERAVLRRRGDPIRVLVLDDRLPDAGLDAGGLGSGFVRARELFEELAHPGFAVALCPTDAQTIARENTIAALGVDVITEPLAEHLLRPEKSYDVVIISRPHNFNVFEMVKAHAPEALLIYDAEALYHKRLWIQARLETDPDRRIALEAEAVMMEQLERRIAKSADRLVAISEDERAWLESVEGHAPVEFMRPLLSGIVMTPANPLRRNGAVFVAGWLAGAESPNADAVRWYSEYVLPHVRSMLPDLRTRVTGKNPPLVVEMLASKHLVLTGFVDSIAELYRSARLAIVPTRIGAGVKNKTMEALQFGVPVVATSIGAEGLGLYDGVEIDITDDPVDFAQRVVALATNDVLWQQRRSAIEDRVAQWEHECVPWNDVVTRTLLAARSRTIAPS